MENDLIKKKTDAMVQRHTWKLLVAAAMVLVVLSVMELRGFMAVPTVKTLYGEVKKQLLPDGTQVMLNANTDLDFKHKEKTTDREVWLKGEAWFQVKQTPGKSRFIVHTAPYDIISTTARFNVVNRNNGFNVYVQEGNLALRASNLSTGKEMYFTTGGYAALFRQRTVTKAVQENEVLAWKEKKLSLSNTSLQELASVIETYYGTKVSIANDLETTVTLNGMMPNTSLDALLQALNASTQLHFEHQGDKVLVTARH